MDNNVKSKIFTTIYAIVLVAVFIGAVQLLYNAIEMLTYSLSGEYTYNAFQKPLAIILFVAALVAFAGVAAGIVSVCVHEKTVQTACRASLVAVVVILLILIIVGSIVWLNYCEANAYPIGVSSSMQFPVYSAVMAMLVPQLAYFAVLAALHIWDFVKSIKKNKKENNEVPETPESGETEKENG